MLKDIELVTKDISKGKKLLLAGDEDLLRQLPKGKWIGGTIPYFMDETGGVITKDKIFVSELPEVIKDIQVKIYNDASLAEIPQNTAENGLSFIIIPANSKAHISYAQSAPKYKDIYDRVIIGWISGVHLNDLTRAVPKAFNGFNGEVIEQEAVVMHCDLEKANKPCIGIINVFEPGDGDIITFKEASASVKECLINGQPVNFADYLKKNDIDTKLPLVGNYCGVSVNVSFQYIDLSAGMVRFYAPAFPGIDYKIARPVHDYVSKFLKALPKEGVKPCFSCNCILNFLYSKLEGKTTRGMTGPFTFGEIAHLLLNQTLVYLEIK